MIKTVAADLRTPPVSGRLSGDESGGGGGVRSGEGDVRCVEQPGRGGVHVAQPPG